MPRTRAHSYASSSSSAIPFRINDPKKDIRIFFQPVSQLEYSNNLKFEGEIFGNSPVANRTRSRCSSRAASVEPCDFAQSGRTSRRRKRDDSDDSENCPPRSSSRLDVEVEDQLAESMENMTIIVESDSDEKKTPVKKKETKRRGRPPKNSRNAKKEEKFVTLLPVLPIVPIVISDTGSTTVTTEPEPEPEPIRTTVRRTRKKKEMPMPAPRVGTRSSARLAKAGSPEKPIVIDDDESDDGDDYDDDEKEVAAKVKEEEDEEMEEEEDEDEEMEEDEKEVKSKKSIVKKSEDEISLMEFSKSQFSLSDVKESRVEKLSRSFFKKSKSSLFAFSLKAVFKLFQNTPKNNGIFSNQISRYLQDRISLMKRLIMKKTSNVRLFCFVSLVIASDSRCKVYLLKEIARLLSKFVGINKHPTLHENMERKLFQSLPFLFHILKIDWQAVCRCVRDVFYNDRVALRNSGSFLLYKYLESLLTLKEPLKFDLNQHSLTLQNVTDLLRQRDDSVYLAAMKPPEKAWGIVSIVKLLKKHFEASKEFNENDINEFFEVLRDIKFSHASMEKRFVDFVIKK